MFFFCGERYAASLEIVDYENYILLEEPVFQAEIFLSREELIWENVRLCIKGKSDIADLLEDDRWLPLGYVRNKEIPGAC